VNSLFKTAALKIQARLTDFDRRSISKPLAFAAPKHHPVFILGAPRSGSTLLYQLVLRYLHAGYISNIMALAPFLMTSIADRLKRYHWLTTLQPSHYGYISGLFSPSEAGAIQRFWFDRELNGEQAVWVRNTFVRLSTAFNKPVIVKNLMNTLRLDRIRTVLPEARFIHIKRDPLYNAQSLLLARGKIHGSDRIWWSIMPQGYEKTLTKEPEFQVIWQVLQTEKILSSFMQAGSPDCMHVHYETLSTDSKKILLDLAAWMDLSVREPIDTRAISNANSVKIPKEKWRRLSNYYSTLKDAI
jgi:LPS sulfotransferase NodH